MQPHFFTYTLSRAVYTLQWWRWVGVTDTPHLTKLKLFTMWLFIGKKKKFGDPCLGQSLSWECVWVHMWQTHWVGGSAWVWVRRLQELVPRFLGTIWAEFWPRHGCEGGVRERAGGVFPGRVRRVVQEGWRVLVTEEAGDVNEDGLSGWKGRTSGGLGVSRQWAALVWGRVRENTEGYSLVIYI